MLYGILFVESSIALTKAPVFQFSCCRSTNAFNINTEVSMVSNLRRMYSALVFGSARAAWKGRSFCCELAIPVFSSSRVIRCRWILGGSEKLSNAYILVD